MGLKWLLKGKNCGKFFIIMMFSLVGLSSLQAQESEWDYWANHDPNSSRSIDHTPLKNIIGAILVENRRDKQLVFEFFGKRGLPYTKAYIEFLEALPISTFNRDEQLAYWINLHNAQVIALLAETKKYRKRVKRERGTPMEPGALWMEKRLTVEGKSLSLNDIEQNILLHNWNNPLILYGLFYGVKGSHLIEGGALDGPTVHTQLEMAANEFINKTRNVKIRKSKLDVSSLYGWNYNRLFGGNDANLIEHLKLYADDKLITKLEGVSQIDTDNFNWRTLATTARGNLDGLQANSRGS